MKSITVKVAKIGVKAPFEYVASAYMPTKDKFGSDHCYIKSWSADNAVLQLLQAAEVDFGYHGNALVVRN